MEINRITHDKKQYIDLLLHADEQEDMIDKYLERGEMYALFDDGLKSLCVVTDEGEYCELKNIATYPEFQGRGYGSALVKFLFEEYKSRYELMMVGTGETPSTLGFYESLGFRYAHRIKDFFTDNYDHPMIECGVRLRDMVYLKKHLG